MGSNQTTATAGGAGAAFGGLVAWGLSALTGVSIDPAVTTLFATVGSFAFGRIFGR